MRALLLAAVLASTAFGCATPPAQIIDTDAGTALADLSLTPDLSARCSPACAAPTPFCNPSHQCVTCLVDGDCPLGTVCKALGNNASACVAGCASDERCRGDGGAAMSCCGMSCTDTTTDIGNCGGCGMACKAAHAKASCSGGKCGSGACDPGFGDCNMNPADGCEVNFHIDPNNCTACGKTCKIANAISACSDGCFMAACQYGYDDCNADASDGCETSVLADPRHCGACGTVCAGAAHAQVSCVAASCTLSCAMGYADCNNSLKDGCEVTISGDFNNCGGCGKICQQGQVCTNGQCTCPMCMLPNANPVCIINQCAIGSCVQGYADCDGIAQNGCEIRTDTDANNCGGCNLACGQNQVCKNGGCTCAQCNIPNAKSSCVNNQCVFGSCLPGFADCDGNPNNGCEVNLSSDNANCSQCGMACPVNMACSLGACSTCANTIIDNAGTLCIPAGQTYSLAGDHCYSSQVIIKGTLSVTAYDGNSGGALIVRAPSILVGANGQIAGNAAGGKGGAPGQTLGGLAGGGAGGGCGGGPGNSVGQGGSGGGYGGAGGTAKPYSNIGQCDRCSNPTVAHCWGMGGPTWGTPGGADLDIGAGGGAGGNSSGCNNAGGRGGAGGASILLLGKTIQIDGSISAGGEQPPADQGCGYHPGGGGGSGGSVVVRAETFSGAGSLTAPGGSGGDTAGMNNDWGWSGGGGGGGRIKVFATNNTFTGTQTTPGGNGGATCTGGACSKGFVGASGTVNASNSIPNAWTTINCGGL